MNRPAPVRIERHSSNLRAFKFRLVYIEGHKMPCDYASRYPPPDKNYSKEEREDMGWEWRMRRKIRSTPSTGW